MRHLKPATIIRGNPWVDLKPRALLPTRDSRAKMPYPSDMRPQVALERQIANYRKMSGEERLAIALRLHELSCDVAREAIRAQYPHAAGEEVERLLRRRVKLARAM
jgi:hypothetical protein